MKRFFVVLPAIALLLGAFLYWLLFCRGESAELRRQIDSALYEDSVARVEIDSLRAANDSLATSVATMRAQLGSALDEVDSLVARPPRVIRVMVPPDTGTGPAVPVDVVLASDFDTLRRSCSAASVLCRQTTDSLALLATKRKEEADKATKRADDLADSVAAFTVPREASRWGLGIAGPITLSFQNEPEEPALVQRYGVCGGATFRIF